MLDLDALPSLMEGAKTRLFALTEAHREPLRSIARDERIWYFYPLRGHDPAVFDAWFDESLQEAREKVTWSFAAYDRASDRLVGTIRYEFIMPAHDRLSLGGTWLDVNAWGAGYNADMNYALLGHAFTKIKAHRVEIRVDGRNVRNLSAWRSFGATEEGILRQIYRTDDGFYADRVVFSILDREWPAVRSKIEAKLNR